MTSLSMSTSTSIDTREGRGKELYKPKLVILCVGREDHNLLGLRRFDDEGINLLPPLQNARFFKSSSKLSKMSEHVIAKLSKGTCNQSKEYDWESILGEVSPCAVFCVLGFR